SQLSSRTWNGFARSLASLYRRRSGVETISRPSSVSTRATSASIRSCSERCSITSNATTASNEPSAKRDRSAASPTANETLSPARRSRVIVPHGTLHDVSEAPRRARPSIVVDSISKTFRVPEERTHTLKERALHPLRKSRFETFRALHGVSLRIEAGEFFGIAG